MPDTVDCAVIGAGIVGLACARRLAQMGKEVVVLEDHDRIGSETSSRNSEVIHAGIYYTPGSLKARYCVQGKVKLYEYCRSRSIPHRQLGKLIVASKNSQVAKLEHYQTNARKNGVDDLTMLDRSQVRAMEPHLDVAGALWSPSTGILDSHALMLSLVADIEASGGIVVLRSRVTGGHADAHRIRLVSGGDSASEIVCSTVINAAGLSAQQVAGTISGIDPRSIPSAYYAKGHYLTLSGRSPFSHLVYPVADDAGLGIHVTLDMSGRARFGPDVVWVDHVDYGFQPEVIGRFHDAIKRYYPGIRMDQLQFAYTGIRPKLVPAGKPAADFLVQGPSEHGVSGLVCLYGIESPGLTAALALADDVARRLERSSSL